MTSLGCSKWPPVILTLFTYVPLCEPRSLIVTTSPSRTSLACCREIDRSSIRRSAVSERPMTTVPLAGSPYIQDVPPLNTSRCLRSTGGATSLSTLDAARSEGVAPRYSASVVFSILPQWSAAYHVECKCEMLRPLVAPKGLFTLVRAQAAQVGLGVDRAVISAPLPCPRARQVFVEQRPGCLFVKNQLGLDEGLLHGCNPGYAHDSRREATVVYKP